MVKKMNHMYNTYDVRMPTDYPWQVMRAVTADLEPYLLPEDKITLSNLLHTRSMESLRQLVEAWGPQSINPVEFDNDINVFRYRYQMASLLKKFIFLDGSDELRRTSALKKFIKAEISCNFYNKRGYKELFESDKIRTKAIITYAKEWIQEVIGNELPDGSKLTLRSRHGPGASSNTSNGNTSQYFKYSEWPYDVTIGCREHAISIISNDKRWLGALEEDYRKRYDVSPTLILNRETFWNNVLNIIPGNKIAFVPKSYETFRTIAIEPTMNLFLQLGVDGFIRKRLKRWLIDLDDQSRNQRLARDGSRHFALLSAFCTLDLSMASDTIALRLLRELLPVSWYHYLYSLRSPSGTVTIGKETRTIKYEKISSMGNGYTFAIESLVFAALCHAVIKYNVGKFKPSLVAVYGDDIIVPRTYATEVIEILQKAGFALNLEKSFIEGPFRESCGADWFNGKPVRPVYLTRMPADIKDLFNDRNRLTRILTLRFDGAPNVKKLFDKWIPSHLKIYGPCSDTESDTYLHSPYAHRGLWKDGAHRFWRLTKNPTYYRGKRVNGLHFRKLMANLSEKPWSERSWDRLVGATEPGKAFEVVRPKVHNLALNNSAVDFWQSQYFERLPSTSS